jgi:magnesium transporter
MDATVGFININQNKIIKIFSVASRRAAAADADRQHLRHELRAHAGAEWTWGYPFALVLMVISVAAPFLFFRRKGWLR